MKITPFNINLHNIFVRVLLYNKYSQGLIFDTRPQPDGRLYGQKWSPHKTNTNHIED
jgi:hypothetical protein